MKQMGAEQQQAEGVLHMRVGVLGVVSTIPAAVMSRASSDIRNASSRRRASLIRR